jgi:hypothetical protein
MLQQCLHLKWQSPQMKLKFVKYTYYYASSFRGTADKLHVHVLVASIANEKKKYFFINLALTLILNFQFGQTKGWNFQNNWAIYIFKYNMLVYFSNSCVLQHTSWSYIQRLWEKLEQYWIFRI